MFRGLCGALVLLTACTSAPLTYGVPTPVGATTQPAATITFTNENWALAVADAGRYKGSPVTLIGRIFLDPERTEGQLAFQMYADSVGNSQNTIVAGLPPSTELKRNDYVRVVGEIHDTVTGMNLMGGVLQVPRIRATSAGKITRAEAVAPTLRDVAVQKAVKQHAIAITLQKIEFAKTETRFFVKIENAGPAKASVHAFNAVVVQGTKQLKPKSSLFESEYPEIPSPMFAGVIAETVLLFDALELAPLRFVWSASSDNYSQRFTDYVWEVTAAAAGPAASPAVVTQATNAPPPVAAATTPGPAAPAIAPTTTAQATPPKTTAAPILAPTPAPTAAPTAPPTPTVSPVSDRRVTVAASGLFKNLWGYSIGLVIVNHSRTEAAESVYVDVYFYDSQGVRYELTATAYVERIDPGKRVGYIQSIYGGSPPAGARTSVTVRTDNPLLRWSAPETGGFTVSNAVFNVSPDAYGRAGTVTGIVASAYPRSYRGIFLTAIGLDANGNVVGGGDRQIDLGAGESSRFSLDYYGSAPTVLMTNALFSIRSR